MLSVCRLKNWCLLTHFWTLLYSPVLRHPGGHYCCLMMAQQNRIHVLCTGLLGVHTACTWPATSCRVTTLMQKRKLTSFGNSIGQNLWDTPPPQKVALEVTKTVSWTIMAEETPHSCIYVDYKYLLMLTYCSNQVFIQSPKMASGPTHGQGR